MTSKEVIEIHIRMLKAQAQIEKDLETGNEIFCEIEIEQYEKILKDLEVLDILKQRVHLKKSFLDENNILFIQTTGFVFENDKEHILLKEWLEK